MRRENRLVRSIVALSLLLLLVGCGRIQITPRGFVVLPPNPVVTPADDKITTREFRALILEDASDSGRAALNAEQRAILQGRNFRKFCSDYGVKDEKGRPDAFRLLDYRDALTDVWAEMKAAHPPDGYPWIILQNGNASYGGKVTTWNALKPVADKYAGVK